MERLKIVARKFISHLSLINADAKRDAFLIEIHETSSTLAYEYVLLCFSN